MLINNNIKLLIYAEMLSSHRDTQPSCTEEHGVNERERGQHKGQEVQDWIKGTEQGEDKCRKKRKEREKREKVSGLIPNKSGLDPDKTSHNAEQSSGISQCEGGIMRAAKTR